MLLSVANWVESLNTICANCCLLRPPLDNMMLLPHCATSACRRVGVSMSILAWLSVS